MADHLSSTIDVPRDLIRLGRLVDRTTRLWMAAGNLESRVFADQLEELEIDRPVFVGGLARSGSTLVLELLHESGLLASQQYRDFPPVYTPVWWNWFLDHVPRRNTEPAERAHKDGIYVTPESPEAIDEIIWIRFFPECHDASTPNLLTAETSNPEFEKFYASHIRKLLLVRERSRYLSKGNYYVGRFPYLRKMFPDARFIVPVRDPVSHIASLVKQHRLFVREESRDPRILEHMKRMGHFEFGLNRQPINVDDGQASEIEALWKAGDEISGWARYWSSLHAHLLKTVGDDSLQQSSLIVRFEDLCREPRREIERVFEHAGLDVSEELMSRLSARPRLPDYYQSGFGDDEIARIREMTGDVAARFGY